MYNTERNPIVQIAVIAGLCLFAFTCNLLVPALFWRSHRYDWLEYCAIFASGVLVAEVALLAIWCGLGQWSLKYRLPVTVTLLIFGACSYCLGLQLPEPNSRMPWLVAALLTGAAIGLFAVMQLPLWLIRRTSQSRIALSKGDQSESPQQKQFGVGYLMILTALFAILLVVVQSSMPHGHQFLSIGEILETCVYLIIYIAVSSLLSIPCVWIALSERKKTPSLVTLAATITVAPFLLFGLTKMLAGQVDSEAIFSIFCYEIGLTGTTLATLVIFRLLGYQVFSNDHDNTRESQDDRVIETEAM
jgi:hypothetical protein